MPQIYHVYILASKRNGTLYTGMTGNLSRRIHQHRTGIGSSFARRYGVFMLVHTEAYDDVSLAIAREKAIKKWRRAWKLELIERDNPDWLDLYEYLA